MAPRLELARRAVHRMMRRIRGGRVELVEAGRRSHFGDPRSELAAKVDIHDPRAYAWTLRGSTGWGEGYAEGLWTTDDLVALARIAARQMPAADRWRRRLHPVLGPLQRIGRLVPANTLPGARSNISAHYDLGNELFEAFLDRRLVYSCARFPEPHASLDDAQVAKLERACELLELGPEDHLLEIGTGWGGLAIHAAATRGCRVTTTTISHRQREYAIERVRAEGLEDRITILDEDYRDLRGNYDKLASIEMIEAVGWQYFPAFFRRCAALLRRGGAMFLQAIVIEDSAYELEKASRSFSNKHIFPGGCLPSLRVIGDLVRDETDMRIAWLEEISADYVRTLRAWRDRFNDAWPALRPRGYDERFRRLWNFYLATSEAGFAERRIRDVQLLLAKPGWHTARKRAATAATSRLIGSAAG
jgi:cyclopropane-fatty-acyl-phospholipid synthase